jgi:hypothetical protein
MKKKFTDTIKQSLITRTLKKELVMEELSGSVDDLVNDETTVVQPLSEGKDYSRVKFDLTDLEHLFAEKSNPEYKLSYKTNLSALDEPANADAKAWIIEIDGSYYLYKIYTLDHSHFYLHYVYGGKKVYDLPLRVRKLITVKDSKYATYSSGLLRLNSESEAKIQAIMDHKNFSRVIKRINDGRIIVETSSEQYHDSKFKICVYLLAKANPDCDVTITGLSGKNQELEITDQKSTNQFFDKDSKNTLYNFLVGNQTKGIKEPEKALSAQASDDFSMSKAMLKRKNLHSLAEHKNK